MFIYFHFYFHFHFLDIDTDNAKIIKEDKSNCEHINLLNELKHATKGFDALAVIIQHLVFDVSATTFSSFFSNMVSDRILFIIKTDRFLNVPNDRGSNCYAFFLNSVFGIRAQNSQGYSTLIFKNFRQGCDTMHIYSLSLTEFKNYNF